MASAISEAQVSIDSNPALIGFSREFESQGSALLLSSLAWILVDNPLKEA